MLAEAEKQLVEKIQQAAIGKKLRKVSTLPDTDTDSLVKLFGTEAPAVYVAPATVMPIKDAVLSAGFGIACVAKNAAGHEAARQGDGKMIGVYDISERVAALLNGVNAGDTVWYVTGISLLQEEKIYKAGLQVAVISIQADSMIESGIDELGDLDDFETFHAQYDIPGHESDSEHSKWLEEPANHSTSKPELEDIVTLNT